MDERIESDKKEGKNSERVEEEEEEEEEEKKGVERRREKESGEEDMELWTYWDLVISDEEEDMDSLDLVRRTWNCGLIGLGEEDMELWTYWTW
ncbi:hypothetical protein Pmani_039746 [Petrolisthes manimaculis]|uniref:Uncharacterized protein n=1 Tax=Petrolisthes manimaculis TaxID=1843537 RepID=A0AAE1TJ20_9EUCA|nr:hypothetical protein Pmani_039746 [Petrolisthes manimaculis]